MHQNVRIKESGALWFFLSSKKVIQKGPGLRLAVNCSNCLALFSYFVCFLYSTCQGNSLTSYDPASKWLKSNWPGRLTNRMQETALPHSLQTLPRVPVCTLSPISSPTLPAKSPSPGPAPSWIWPWEEAMVGLSWVQASWTFGYPNAKSQWLKILETKLAEISNWWSSQAKTSPQMCSVWSE